LRLGVVTQLKRRTLKRWDGKEKKKEEGSVHFKLLYSKREEKPESKLLGKRERGRPKLFSTERKRGTDY